MSRQGNADYLAADMLGYQKRIAPSMQMMVPKRQAQIRLEHRAVVGDSGLLVDSRRNASLLLAFDEIGKGFCMSAVLSNTTQYFLWHSDNRHACKCPVSEVRDTWRHSLTRTSETKGH
jgi:hypothetical protein